MVMSIIASVLSIGLLLGFIPALVHDTYHFKRVHMQYVHLEDSYEMYLEPVYYHKVSVYAVTL